MIKNFTPQPYEGATMLPSYATKVRTYTLYAKTANGYEIILALSLKNLPEYLLLLTKQMKPLLQSQNPQRRPYTHL